MPFAGARKHLEVEAIPFPPPPVLESNRTFALNMDGPKLLQSINYK